MSVAGAAVAILLMAIFIPPIYHYFATPADGAGNSTPAESTSATPGAGPLQWTPFVSSTGAYSVDLPGTPVTVVTTPNSFGGLPGVDSPASVHLASQAQFSVGRVAVVNEVEIASDSKINGKGGDGILCTK